MGGLVRHLLDRQFAGLDVLDHRRQGVLHQRQTGRRGKVALRLLVPRVRGMVGGDDVDAVFLHRLLDRQLVGAALDRRIAFEVRAERRVPGVVEEEVMHAGFGGDALARQRPRREQAELLGGGDVQHVQARAVRLRQRHRQRRGLVAGIHRADARMLGEGDVVAEARRRRGFVGENGRRVFAVRGDEQRTVREDALQGAFVVHQHVARGRAHEHLDAAGLGDVHRLDRFQVVVGGAQIEGEVGHRAPRGAGVLVEQRGVVHRLRIAVRHLHHAGDAAGRRRAGFAGDVALVLEARFAEMHLVVDHARQQPRAGQRDLLRADGAETAADAFDAAIADGHVGNEAPPLVDDRGFLQHPIGHEVPPRRRHCPAALQRVCAHTRRHPKRPLNNGIVA